MKKKIIGIQTIKFQDNTYYKVFYTYSFSADDTASGVACGSINVYNANYINGINVGDTVFISTDVSSKGSKFCNGIVKV